MVLELLIGCSLEYLINLQVNLRQKKVVFNKKISIKFGTKEIENYNTNISKKVNKLISSKNKIYLATSDK